MQIITSHRQLAWSVVMQRPVCPARYFDPRINVWRCSARMPVWLQLGKTYLRIVLIVEHRFLCRNYSVTAFARNDNATSIGNGRFSCLAVLWNIVFRLYFYVPGMGLGFAGAALATAFCPVVTMLGLFMLHYSEQKMSLSVSNGRRLSVRHLISCCQLGVSAFVGEISSAVIAFVFNMLILGLAGSVPVWPLTVS